jgi:hypothetical protein
VSATSAYVRRIGYRLATNPRTGVENDGMKERKTAKNPALTLVLRRKSFLRSL